MLRCTMDMAIPKDSKCNYCCLHCNERASCEYCCIGVEEWNEDEAEIAVNCIECIDES